jgi:ATP-dependent DNA helicase RecG
MATHTEVLEIIANGESSGVEFKRDVLRNHDLAKELVAFSNPSGGMVFLASRMTEAYRVLPEPISKNG